MAKRKNSSRLKFDKYIILLSIISILLLASFIRYALRTYKVPEWDEQHYMRMATEFYRLLQHPAPDLINRMFDVVAFRQIGYPLLILPFLLIFGLSNSYFWGIFTNGLLYISTIIGIYLIAKEYLSKLSAFLAAILFASYGWTLWHAHLTYSETAVSAFAVWTIYFLIKSDLFRNKNYSILFGIFFGLGILMKWITAVYLAGPLLYSLYHIFAKQLFKERVVLVNIALALSVSIIIPLYLYYHNFQAYFQNLYTHRIGGPVWEITDIEERNPLSQYSLTYYLNSFSQLGIFHFILIIAGVILSLRRAKQQNNLNFILVTVVAVWFFSTYSILKGERYIIPIYPYLAILSASVFDYIKNTRVKIALIILTIVISIGAFLGTVWGKGPMKHDLYSIKLPFAFGRMDKIYLTSVSRPPYIYKISGKEIVDFLVSDSRASRIDNPQVLSLFYYHSLDEPIMSHNLYDQEKSLSIINFLGTVAKDPNDTDYFLNRMAFNSDYVLIKTGQKIDKTFSEENIRLLGAFIKLFDRDVDLKKHYEQKAKFWIYQDSSEVIVYKKRVEVPKEEIERLKLKLRDYLSF